MDNQDNTIIPINPIQNSIFFSPNKSSPIKVQNVSKNNNHYAYNQSPFPSHLNLYNTPNKIDNAILFSNFGETPNNYNYNFLNMQMSPLNNNQNLSYKKIENITEKK